MLLSMTGFGDARHQDERLSIAVEIKTVNNRYLKISTKCPEPYAALESEIEKVVRGTIARGTVLVTIRLDRPGGEARYSLDGEMLGRYWSDLVRVSEKLRVPAPADLSSLLALPGAVVEPESEATADEGTWPRVREALQEALGKLQEFRRAEGRTMQADLETQSAAIAEQVERVAQLSPDAVRDYRDRLHERVRELLEQTDADVQPADLIREVSIFAERADVNEELMRLRSHLEQFLAFMGRTDSMGRKLDFLSQEMFREVNTIGSKANNVSIAHAVVEMKAAVDKIREILQNVE